MNSSYSKKWYAGILGGLLLLTFGSPGAKGADFTVTSPGFFYAISGLQGQNPTITLVRGRTYTFAINAGPTHPFQIQGAGTNVVNNNIFNGTLTFNVPTNAVDYTYICSIHFFSGKIVTVDPPAPPTIQIVSLTVGTKLILTSTGTNTWKLIPEFTPKVTPATWAPLTVETNTFANGTNDTICARPPDNDVFIRIRAEEQ